MDPVSTVSPSISDSVPRGGTFLRPGVIGGLAATVATASIWAGGRAADVSFRLDPAASDLIEVGIALVIVATVAAFGLGWVALTLAARRSRRWARIVIVSAAVVAITSVGGPLTVAEDMSTGVLLASMHLAAGTAFVATAAMARMTRN